MQCDATSGFLTLCVSFSVLILSLFYSFFILCFFVFLALSSSFLCFGIFV